MKLSKKYIVAFASALCIFLIAYFILALNIGINAEQDTKRKSDVILVLGARSFIGGQYNPCLKARVEHAVNIYKKGYASKILMTGGDDKEDNVNEAETMKKIAVENGVNEQDILLEKQATSTFENFTNSKQILNKNKLKSVIIITEPFHLLRSSLVAEKLNYNFTVSPAIDSPCWKPNKYLSKYSLKEPFAIGMYRLQKKL